MGTGRVRVRVRDGGATITPDNFEDMIDRDGPYCVSGTVAATSDYTSIAAVAST
jgi:hypothetical protein